MPKRVASNLMPALTKLFPIVVTGNQAQHVKLLIACWTKLLIKFNQDR